MNYLAPHLRSDPWTESEDELLIAKMNELGSAWSSISQFFRGRSDNDVKNRWYSHLRYVTARQGNVISFTDDGTERKKRKRTRLCPQQSAWLLLKAELQTGSPGRDEVKDIPNEYASEMIAEDIVVGFWEFE
jgi:hypothetical protein